MNITKSGMSRREIKSLVMIVRPNYGIVLRAYAAGPAEGKVEKTLIPWWALGGLAPSVGAGVPVSASEDSSASKA